MHSGTLVLAILFAAGLLGGNDLVALAAGVMLALQATATPSMFRFLQQYASQLGITFLLIGFLLPFATGKLGLDAARSLFSTSGLISLAVGVLSACLAADGVRLLSSRPEVMVGLVFGSVLGVFFFEGVPSGPLIGAGLAALLFRFVS